MSNVDEQKLHEDQETEDQKECVENEDVQRQPGEIRKILRTSDFYKTKNLPERFDRPDLLQGYSTKHEHPMYTTTTADYGSRAPTVHTMPKQFHGRCQKFSKNLGQFGMYRNHSLNTAKDHSNV